MKKQRTDLRRIVIAALFTAAFMWVILYAPTPYVLYEPGLAVPVKPMVKIEKGDSLGQGDFLLTAVKLTEPNFLRAIQSMWDSEVDLHLKRDVFRGYSKGQYAERLNVIMQGSQNNAIEAAYKYAGLSYGIEAQGIVITDVNASDNIMTFSFKAGDKLLGIVGGEQFDSMEQVFDILRSKTEEEKVSIALERGGNRVIVKIPPVKHNSSLSNEQWLNMLGIAGLTELRSLEPADSRDRLSISAGDIGGPSAGLVFALQALDLLTAGDLSGGHRIAATGTISVDGGVGAIGGIKQKIVIASKQGAQLFLAPADNYKEAAAKAKSIKSTMKVVSVSTLKEAVERIEAFNAAV
ncbi:PDZ domain-containing protein [Paenibacillus castaneae]|uniref:YlbL family protein n=1 Tax=Paenibacillus castaneae TaxID=474957 RepID=UPI000C9A8640|nr:S16 family serine protease [Paenibacillus castaneae]NIK75668.1 PDZ domain-containing protein [Paenibacillus castaneae]